jgi:hypothetical protein
MASVPGRTANAWPVTPAPLVTKLHHDAALATHGGGGTSNGAQIGAPAHNKDAHRDKEVDHAPRDSRTSRTTRQCRGGRSGRLRSPMPGRRGGHGQRCGELLMIRAPSRRCASSPDRATSSVAQDSFGTSACPVLPGHDGLRSAEISVSGLPARCSRTPRFRYGSAVSGISVMEGGRLSVVEGRGLSSGGVLYGYPAGKRTGGAMTAIRESVLGSSYWYHRGLIERSKSWSADEIREY